MGAERGMVGAMVRTGKPLKCVLECSVENQREKKTSQDHTVCACEEKQ